MEESSRIDRYAQAIDISRQPMLVLAVVAWTGMTVDRLGLVNAWQWVLVIIAAGMVACITFRQRAYQSSLVLMCFASVCGLHRHQQYHRFSDVTLAKYVSYEWTPVIVHALVESPVQLRPDTLTEQRSELDQPAWQSMLQVRIISVRDGRQDVPAEGLARVVVDGKLDGLLYGDRIQLHCSAQRIPAPTNPGEIDLQRIYRSRRQLIRIHVDSPSHIRKIKPAARSILRGVYSAGDRAQRALEANIDARVVPLAHALVLGRRQAVDRQLRDQLLVTGTIHLLAVSGLHVGIVAVAITWLTLILGVPRTWALVAIILVCLSYMLLTGARPPVVRAATLISLFLVGRLIGNRVDPVNTLATAAIILIVFNPLAVHQTGTLLSFLAVATIIMVDVGRPNPVELDPLDVLLRSRLARLVVWIKNVSAGLFRFVTMSFWLSVVAMPLVWYHFHIVSFISIIANILLWIPITIALISGLITSIAGCIWEPLGVLPGMITQWSLQAIVQIVQWLADIRGSHLWLPPPPIAMVVVFYLTGGCIALMRRRVASKAIVVGLVAAWFLSSLWMSTRAAPRNRLVATFIDVGHGTSVLVQLPGGENWLYDAGRLGDPVVARWPIESVLWSEGIRTIDTVLISHADADHYNAISGLATRFVIGRIIGSEDLFDSPDRGIIDLHAQLGRHGIPIQSCSQGETLYHKDSVRIIVLHPPMEHIGGSDNANSIVLHIQCFGQSILLPGDLEDPGTANVLAQRGPEPGGVLMSPHHGSLSQDAFPVLQWARPSVVVTSGGRRAAQPRAIKELSETGAEVYVTHRDGAVRVVIQPSGIGVRTWNSDPW